MEEKQEPVVKTSIAQKFKKNLASKAATSTLGKKAIMHFLGVQGVSLLDSVDSATEKLAGSSRAKQLQGRLLRIALKTKLMADENKLKVADTLHLIDPLQYFLVKLNTAAQQNVVDAPLLDSLIANFNRIAAATLQLLSPHMRDKNISKLTDVLQYYGSREFVDPFLNQDKLRNDKVKFTQNLGLLLKPLLDQQQRSVLPTCAGVEGKQCTDNALAKSGDFLGSSRCLSCHQKYFAGLQAAVSAATSPGGADRQGALTAISTHFAVDDGKTYTPYADTVTVAGSKVELETLRYYSALLNFHTAQARIKRVFALELYKKYVSPSSAVSRHGKPELPEDEAKALASAVEAVKGGKPLPDDIYTKAQQLAKDVVEAAIVELFLPSPACKRYFSTEYALPEYLLPPSQ